MARYQAGVDESGVVLFVNMDIYSDSGFSFYEDTAEYATLHARVYSFGKWIWYPYQISPM